MDEEHYACQNLTASTIAELARLVAGTANNIFHKMDYLEDHPSIKITTGLPTEDKYKGIPYLRNMAQMVFMEIAPFFAWHLEHLEFGLDEDEKRTILVFKFRPKDTLEKLVHG